MNRKLLVTLLRKDIQELDMITEGFMEMNEFPMAIIHLAQKKTEDIQSYIIQLQTSKSNFSEETTKTTNTTKIDTESALTETIASINNKKDVEVNETVEILEVIDIKEFINNTEKSETFDIIEEKETIVFETANQNKEIQLTSSEIDIDKKTEQVETMEISNTPPEHEIKLTILESKKTILGEKNILSTPTRNEMLTRADNTISSTLANKKVDDIKQAISIGDRFRFQRELFKANGEDMNKTLTYINQLATVEEVFSFLRSKYGWTSDNETAEDFYQVVRRRFL